MTNEEMTAVILNHARECLELKELSDDVVANREAYQAQQDITEEARGMIAELRAAVRAANSLSGGERGSAISLAVMEATQQVSNRCARSLSLYADWVLAEAKHEDAVAKHYEGLAKLIAHNEQRDWYFTFGSDHENAMYYVMIHGTFAGAREEMIQRHGAAWAFQYRSAEVAGVDRFGLCQLADK